MKLVGITPTERPERRTPHGVRGLKYAAQKTVRNIKGRTPHGVRGLKSELSTRPRAGAAGRTPHGVRGLKLRRPISSKGAAQGRTPHGVRGLKWDAYLIGAETPESHPARGAWIEIESGGGSVRRRLVAPRTGCVD